MSNSEYNLEREQFKEELKKSHEHFGSIKLSEEDIAVFLDCLTFVQQGILVPQCGLMPLKMKRKSDGEEVVVFAFVVKNPDGRVSITPFATLLTPSAIRGQFEPLNREHEVAPLKLVPDPNLQ